MLQLLVKPANQITRWQEKVINTTLN